MNPSTIGVSILEQDKVKVRLGKLSGITDDLFGSLQGYGLYSENAYLTGKINALAGGKIAGWDINQYTLSKIDLVNNTQAKIDTSVPSIFIGKNGSYAHMGKIWNQSYVDRWGFSIYHNNDLFLQMGISNEQYYRYIYGTSATYLQAQIGQPYFRMGDDSNYIAYSTPNGLMMSGFVTAYGGNIGGWIIGNYAITSQDQQVKISSVGYIGIGDEPPTTYGNNAGIFIGADADVGKMSLYNNSNNYLQWDGLKLTVKSANFTLDANGNITASNALISGNISSSAGTIGGWSLTGSSIYRTNSTYGNSTGMYFGTSGLSIKDVFLVDSNGNLTASKGKIGGSSNGWTISSGKLSCLGTGIIETSTSANTGIKINNQGIYGYNGTNQSLNLSSSGQGWIGLSTNKAIQWTTAGVVKVGNFTASGSCLYNGKTSLSAGVGVYIGTDGIALGNATPQFMVTSGGVLITKSGSIAGWNITSSKISKDTLQMKVDSTYWNLSNPSSMFPTPSSTITTISNINVTCSMGLSQSNSVYTSSALTINKYYNYKLKIGTMTTNTTNASYCIQVIQSGSNGEIQHYQQSFLSGSNQFSQYNFTLKTTKTSPKLKTVFTIKQRTGRTFGAVVDFIDDSQININQYSPLVQLSNRGLFIFNDLSNYIRIGNASSSSDANVPIADIKMDNINFNKANIETLRTNNINSLTTSKIILNNKLMIKNSLIDNATRISNDLIVSNEIDRYTLGRNGVQTRIVCSRTANINSFKITMNTQNGTGSYGVGAFPAMIFNRTDDGGDGNCRFFMGYGGWQDTTDTFTHYFNGSVASNDDIIAYVSSDIRLKQNLKLIDSPLHKISQINGYHYNFKDNTKPHLNNKKQNGIIAQQIQKILPDAVVQRYDGYLAVDYKQIIPLLLQCIKQLNIKITDLQTKIK